MKIAITGSDYGLGKNLSLILSSEYQVLNLKENIEKLGFIQIINS